MNKIKLSKLIQNHIHIIGLITLVFIAFISTTYYASYKKKQIERAYHDSSRSGHVEFEIDVKVIVICV